MARKPRRLDKVKLLKEISRERLGPPKPGKVLKTKKRSRLAKAITKDVLEEIRSL